MIIEYPVPTAFSWPAGIAAGPDGALWFAEQLGDQMGRITTAGDITEYAVVGNGIEPEAIVAGPDGALWFSLGNTYRIGRVTTAGVVTSYPMPLGGFSYGIATGPDGGLWFTEVNTGRVGRAPACGLGFGASFAGTTLTMNFNLGIDTAATFDILLHSASGVAQPFSKQIPAVVPPRAFTMTWSDVPNLGDVDVQALLTTGAGQAICSEWNWVNTAR